MDEHVKAVVRACTIGSDTEQLTFGEVVIKLMEAGVERYHADLTRAEKTYYMPDGSSLVVPSKSVQGIVAESFSADGVDAAVRAIQGGQIQYTEFCERIAAAGCVDYTVSLTGRRAVYCGRTADSHVERFPKTS